MGYLSAEPEKPFSAQIITTGHSRTETGEIKPESSLVDWFVARDRDGRIRDEKRPSKLDPPWNKVATLTWPDGTTSSTSSFALNQVIMIFDCSAGTAAQVRPAMRYATIQNRWEPSVSIAPRLPFSARLPNPNGKPSPTYRVEDLGLKNIQGVTAHGVRLTALGTEADGEWNGKPVRESEQWASDELAAMMLIMEKDFRTGRDSRQELANIRLGDPDPALFAIPSDYKINPKPEDLPQQFLDRSVTVPRH
ncbi:MAG TPA: hypothetical protein VK805_19675 [Candidatus Baltobacteraceae bacterium]|jgi:hypothetical protein|nr:hypothetical protein [Candidatus Baltobacteraceae bacterium]